MIKKYYNNYISDNDIAGDVVGVITIMLDASILGLKHLSIPETSL